MATMPFKDMLREAGYANIDQWRRSSSIKQRGYLTDLIQQHGLDFDGLVNEIAANYRGDTETEKIVLHQFFEDHGGFVKDGSLDAPTEKIREMFLGKPKGYINYQHLPLFSNITPDIVANIRWPMAFSSNEKERFTKLMQVPEFRKAVLGNIENISNWNTVISTMSNLSREDAEYVMDKYQNATAAALAGGAPKELIKAVIRNASTKSNLFFGMRKDFVKVVSEMIEDPSEPRDVKKYLGRLVLSHSVSGNQSSDAVNATQDDFKPLVHKIPPEDFKTLLEEESEGRIERIVDGLNRNELPREHSFVADEFARKRPSTATIRFVNNGRGNELTTDELQGVWDKYVDDVRNRPYESSFSRADKHQMANAIGSLPKETIDRLVEQNKNKQEILSTLGMWKYTNRYGEQPSDQQTQASTEQLSGFLRNKLLVDSLARLNGSATSFMTLQDIEKMAPWTKEPEIVMKLLTHPNVTPKAVNDVLETGNADELPTLDRVLEGFGRSDHITDWNTSIIKGNHGEKTDVRVGSTALRHLRDHLDQLATQGTSSVRPEDLPKGRTFNTLTRAVTDKKGNVQHVLDWNPLRDNRAGGNLTSDKVRQAVDAMPVRPVMVRQSGVRWTGAQNHTKNGTSVLQFMPPKEVLQQFKDNGLYTAFGEMSLHHMRDGTSHPTAPFHLGWVRFNIDHDKKEIFIDEIQSDLHSSFRKLMKDPKNKLKSQMQSVVDTLFGKHHPSEVLHEAAHQFFRDKGYEGYKISIHGLKSKAHMSLGDQDKEPPAHFKEGYDAIPKKMGYTPAKYGDLSIETGDGDYRAGGLKGMDTHGTKVVKFEEMLFELSKGEW